MPFKKGHFINLGRKHTKKTKIKISEANKGKIAWNKGLIGYKTQPHSEATKRKIGKANAIALKGRKLSEKTKKKISKANKEEKAWQWKGDDVGYHALHAWVVRHKGKPTKCEHCGKDGLKGHEIHWANKSGKYLRNLNDWLRLCVKCHKKYDKAQRNLQ